MINDLKKEVGDILVKQDDTAADGQAPQPQQEFRMDLNAPVQGARP